MTEISEVCNLSARDREIRRQELRGGLVSKARRKEAMPDGLALFFDATAEMRSELDAFVAFENQCCPGLGFSVRDAPGGLRLEITGVDPAASFLTSIGIDGVAEATRTEQPESPGWLRLVRPAGLGAIGAVVLFCGVPIGGVAVLGAQFAAPLGVLDNPWIIGAGALVFAGFRWRWERRREAARASAGNYGC